jgi:hypothetical protein
MAYGKLALPRLAASEKARLRCGATTGQGALGKWNGWLRRQPQGFGQAIIHLEDGTAWQMPEPANHSDWMIPSVTASTGKALARHEAFAARNGDGSGTIGSGGQQNGSVFCSLAGGNGL